MYVDLLWVYYTLVCGISFLVLAEIIPFDDWFSSLSISELVCFDSKNYITGGGGCSLMNGPVQNNDAHKPQVICLV